MPCGTGFTARYIQSNWVEILDNCLDPKISKSDISTTAQGIPFKLRISTGDMMKIILLVESLSSNLLEAEIMLIMC